ncbi:MAG: MFS transporter [Dehalococcoidia bacterium]|nr:MFS transporter [Dehalococcoidia bacterium]
MTLLDEPDARPRPRTPALEALRIPDYRRLWLGNALTGVGLNFWFVGSIWLVFSLSGSPFLIGLVNGLSAAPSIVLSVVGGALADRVDRRRMLVGARVVWALLGLSVGALVVLGRAEPWHVLAAALVFGMADAASTPAAHTLLVDIVGKSRLVTTNALDQINEYGGELLAPLAAGLLIAIWGGATFFIAACLVGLGALSIARIRLRLPHGPSEDTAPPRGLLTDIGAGLGYTLRTRPFPLLLGLSALSLLSAAVTPLVPLYARDVLEVGAAGFGGLLAAFAGGMLLGALGLASLRELPRPGPTIAAARAAWFLAMAAFALSTSFLVSLALLVTMGFAGAVSNNLLLTQFQAQADDQMRGRVMSIHRIADSLEPGGAVLGGALAAMIGGERTLLLCAALGLVALLAMLPRALALREA